MTACTWQASDKAYQLHHVNCPTCSSAGRKPGELQRCPEGSARWETYQQAGMPPQFTWRSQGGPKK